MPILEDLKKHEHDRGKLAADMQALLDTAKKENRDLNQEENTRWDNMYNDFKSKAEEIKRLKGDENRTKLREERMLEVEKELAASVSSVTGGSNIIIPGQENRSIPAGAFGGDLDPRMLAVIQAAVASAATGGREQRAQDEKDKEYRALFNKFLLVGENKLSEKELRSLVVGDPTQGGYFVAPAQMGRELIRDVDNECLIRNLARILPPLQKAVSCGYPQLTQKMGQASWSGELYNAPEDKNIRTGRRMFFPNPKSAFTKIGIDFMRNSSVDADALLREEIARVMAELEEQAYIMGDGDKKPLGLLTDHPDGITSARHLSTGNTTTAITFDGLINAKFNLKPQYRKSKKLNWLVHPDFVRDALKIKDLNGQYIWQQNVKAGEPDLILNVPVVESMFMPNTFTTGSLVGIIGDFYWYWIVDTLGLEIKVLDQLFQMTNEIGYLARGNTDGLPVKAEAFTIVKLA